MEYEQSNKSRSGGGRIQKIPYSKERIDELKFLITDLYEQEQPKRYSILVNGELVVGTNTDPENFDKYLPYIKPFTETVEVRLYFGDSPSANRYIFELQPERTSLQGIKDTPLPTEMVLSVETRIAGALERQRLETQNELLYRENKRLKKKLKKTKAKVVESPGIDMKELLSQGLQLYGQMKGGSNTATPVQGLPVSEVEIEEESEVDRFYSQLKDKYTETQLEQALKTWELFVKHPELRAEFQHIITSKKQ